MGFILRRYIRALFIILTLAHSFESAATSSSGHEFPRFITEVELSQILSFYRSIQRLDVNFDQVKTLKEVKIALKSKGKLQIEMLPEQQSRIIWQITEPSVVTVKLNPKEIVFETGAGESRKTQVIQRDSLGKSKENQSLQSLVVWLQMDAKLLSKEYEVTQVGAKQYQFVPKQPEISPFSKLNMTLRDQTYVDKLVLNEKSGDILEINFGQPKTLRSNLKK